MEGIRVTVRVVPGSRKNGIERDAAGIRVRLTAPPVEGKANLALLAFLAAEWGLRKNQLALVSGEKSRVKVVAVLRDEMPDALRTLLEGAP